jgi:GNAT superfamily N-acetyltransferase
MLGNGTTAWVASRDECGELADDRLPGRQGYGGLVNQPSTPVLTHDLVQRLLGSEMAYMSSMLEVFAPHGEATLQWFDHVLAFASPTTDHRAWNRALGLRSGDEELVDEILAWADRLGAPIRLELVPATVDEALLSHVAERGLQVTGFRSAVFGIPSMVSQSIPPGPKVEEIGEDRLEFFAEVWAQTVPTDDRHRTRKLLPVMAEAYAAPEWRRFVAWVEGSPVAFGVLHVAERIGSLTGAATAPEHRGRGAQSVLIAHRLAAAREAGCTIVVSQPPIGSSSQRNLERARLRLAYQSALWQRPT